MPSKTAKQARFMRMCASTRGRKKAKGKCPPQSVAREFTRADSRKKRKHKARRKHR
jgi:hypothetical protein